MTAAEAVPAEDLDLLAGRVDAALARVADLPAPVRAVATELKDALDALHRAGLARVVADLRADPRDRELLFALVDVPEVRALLQLHGLVRVPDLATRTRAAVEAMAAAGSAGELVRVDGTTAVLRLPGATGCSGAEHRDRVSAALLTAVPGLTAVEVEEPPPAPTLVPLASLTVRSAPGWVDGPDRLGVLPGQLRRVPLGSSSAVVLVVSGTLAAWVNACPRQGEPLDAGRLDADDGTLVCPAHGLEFDALTGRSRSDPGLALVPVAARVAGTTVQLRAPDGPS